MKYLKGCLIGVAIILAIIGLLMTGFIKFYPEKVQEIFGGQQENDSTTVVVTDTLSGSPSSYIEIPIKVDSGMNIQIKVSGVPMWFKFDPTAKRTVIGPVEYKFLKKHGEGIGHDSILVATIKVADQELSKINFSVTHDSLAHPTLGMDVLEKMGGVVQINYEKRQLVILKND